MSTSFSMLQIMNAALISQGQDEIVSEGDGSVEWRLLSRNWPLIVEAELEDGNYLFSREQVQMNNRSDGAYGYDDRYLVTPGTLFIRHVWYLGADGARIEPDWTADANYVYIDWPSGIYAERITTQETDLWGPNFCRGVQKALESVILMAIKEEAQEAQVMMQLAETHFQRARTVSSKQRRPQPAYRVGPIAQSRFRRIGARGISGEG